MNARAVPSRKQIQEQVRAIVAEVCAIDASKLDPARSLVEYGLDSARAVDVVVALERTFGVFFDTDETAGMTTLQGVVSKVAQKLGG